MAKSIGYRYLVHYAYYKMGGGKKNNNQFLPKNWLNLLYTYANSDPTVLEKKSF